MHAKHFLREKIEGNSQIIEKNHIWNLNLAYFWMNREVKKVYREDWII